jgi:hypothetical protein
VTTTISSPRPIQTSVAVQVPFHGSSPMMSRPEAHDGSMQRRLRLRVWFATLALPPALCPQAIPKEVDEPPITEPPGEQQDRDHYQNDDSRCRKRPAPRFLRKVSEDFGQATSKQHGFSMSFSARHQGSPS